MALGGNRSGKTETSAYDVARRVLFGRAPVSGLPFWVISKSYEMVGNISWGEKLKKYIHPRNIKWISYINKARDWPSAVGLTSGWTLEFKSWEQGRDAFQARSIGGAWFDEQFPPDVFLETYARTSDYDASISASLTPIDPDAYLQAKYDDPPPEWEFFEFDLNDNRLSNGGYLSDSWVDQFIFNTPEDFRDVRVRGKFAGFEGAVYKAWRRDIHVIDPYPDNMPPNDGICVRGIDFGFNNPFVCLWMHRDGDGIWTVYDEHYLAKELTETHVKAIKSRKTPRQGFVRTWADPEDAQSRAELAAVDLYTSTANKEIRSGCESVAKALIVQPNGKPRLRVTRNCKNTIREVPSYHYEKNSTGRRDASDHPCKKDDHTCDALRYIIYNEQLNGDGWESPGRINGGNSMADGFTKVMG